LRAAKLIGLCQKVGEFGGGTHDAYAGKALEKIAAVGFCPEAWVEDGDDTAVGAAADETADALFERYHGLRDAVIKEGAAAVLFDEAGTGRDDGVGRYGERELIDD